MTELKPCPFCGGEAKVIESKGLYWVACMKCCASADVIDDRDKAIEAWNRRVSDVNSN